MAEVDHEYLAGERAVALLLERLACDPNFLDEHKLGPRDAIRLAANLEATYLVRLFAEFEAGLRSYWGRGLNRDTRPPASDLIDAVGAKRNIARKWVIAAHGVREYRNRLMHDDHARVDPIPLAESRTRLCRYFSRLPLSW